MFYITTCHLGILCIGLALLTGLSASLNAVIGLDCSICYHLGHAVFSYHFCLVCLETLTVMYESACFL